MGKLPRSTLVKSSICGLSSMRTAYAWPALA